MRRRAYLDFGRVLWYYKAYEILYGGADRQCPDIINGRLTGLRRKKEKTDAQKGKIFTKIGREIAIAVREGGSADPATNGKLRDVIAKAKANNMPNDNIKRSIAKAAGEGSGASYKEVSYEGYADGGVAVIVDVVTDNLNRTASEIRHLFDKFGKGLGATGCVAGSSSTRA